MISRGNENFAVRHYDWIVAGVAGVALLASVGYFVTSLGGDGEAEAAAAVSAIDRQKPAECGVEKTDMTPFEATIRQAKNPTLIAEIDGTRESVLASERRVKCSCGEVLPAGLEACPACKASLVVVNKEDEAAKKLERWKSRYGVEADGTDKDGDGFTNEEEYAKGTDPTDAKDHPDYLDSLELTLPLKETYVPFALLSATKIPAGWRCEFFDPKRKDDYGRMGRTFTTVVGEDICVPVTKTTGAASNEPTGYVLKGFEKKEEKRALMAGSTMTKAVDVSVATVSRKSDNKTVELTIQSKKRVKLAPIDVQATLVYERMGTKTFDVIAGDEIELNGVKYEVVSIKSVGNGAEVNLKDKMTGRQKTLKKPLE